MPGSLYPTTATTSSSARYATTLKVKPAHAVIDAGMSQDSPMYLSQHWSSHIHPEGALYFHRHSPVMQVVTSAYLYSSEIDSRIREWVIAIETMIFEKSIAVTKNVDLVLQLDGEDCYYYLANHDSQSLFWLDRYDTDDLGLLPVASPSHLKQALTEQYWSHVETYPMHFGGLTPGVVDDLISVFAHGFVDQLTSRYSTFPYSQKESKKILAALEISRDLIHDGRHTCYVGRLWQLVYHHRFWTHYGEPHARLSRDQAIFEEVDDEIQWTRPILSALTLKTFDTTVQRLDEIYIDRFIYVDQWRPFITSSLKSWQRTSYASAVILMLHAFFFVLASSVLFASISGALLGGSLLTSILLSLRHEDLEEATASEALTYLNAVCSKRCKLQLVALAYSLPKALYLWGTLLFIFHWVLIACQAVAQCTSFSYAAGFFGIFMVLLMAFQRATSHSEKMMPFLTFSHIFTRTEEKLEHSMA